MGKQLYFAHTEEDICQLLSFLEKLHVKIIIDRQVNEPSKLYARILNEMCEYRNPQYSLVFVPDDSYKKTVEEARVADGTAIEIMNCWKWSSGSNTYYDKGRIYLSKTKAGEYDKQMIALYNKLCSYFRKNYIFHKSLGIFFSPVFENKLGLGKVFLSQLGQPIDVQ